MAGNDFGNTPPSTGNDAPADEEYGGSGEAVPCLHIYKMADGSFGVHQATAPAPADLEMVANPEEVLAKAQEFLEAPAPDDAAMTAAKAGYAKTSKAPQMAAPNPGAVFGE